MTQEPEHWLLRKARLAAEMAAKNFRLTVTPKRASRTSGPYPAGDKWFTPFGQMELEAEQAGLLGDRCFTCGHRIIKASGELIGGRCGGCNTASLDHDDTKPAA